LFQNQWEGVIDVLEKVEAVVPAISVFKPA